MPCLRPRPVAALPRLLLLVAVLLLVVVVATTTTTAAAAAAAVAAPREGEASLRLRREARHYRTGTGRRPRVKAGSYSEELAFEMVDFAGACVRACVRACGV